MAESSKLTSSGHTVDAFKHWYVMAGGYLLRMTCKGLVFNTDISEPREESGKPKHNALCFSSQSVNVLVWQVFKAHTISKNDLEQGFPNWGLWVID